jgi:hypothetical protein
LVGQVVGVGRSLDNLNRAIELGVIDAADDHQFTDAAHRASPSKTLFVYRCRRLQRPIQREPH